MQNYRDLRVWQKSMELVGEVYRITKLLPTDERFSLVDQMRRAAISIPSNIAEGYGRYSTTEYIRFLSIARGSKNELETQLLLCVQLKYLTQSDIDHVMLLCEDIGKKIFCLKKSLEQIKGQ